MPDFLTIIQLVAAVLMVVMILMQSGGAGLGSAFGGGGDAYTTKRGAEKTIFRSTIAFAFVFVIIGVIRLFI
ncbi:MAG: preprotein translocase subunit SecG [Patescibacteria group bacterium]